MSESCPHNYVTNRKVWIKEAIFYLRASDGKISSQSRKILFCGPVGCSSPSHSLPKKFKICISSPKLHQHSPNTLPGNNHVIQTLPLQATCKKNYFKTHYKLLHDAIHMRVNFGSTTLTAESWSWLTCQDWGFESTADVDVCLVSVMWYQWEISAKGWSLRSPTKYAHVFVCHRVWSRATVTICTYNECGTQWGS